ncbi:transporter substrate-binding domain-containing protein [Pseudomonas vancouverensis]|uniref:histidine kinase n=1 Tax=Pseudomonas vancouverensis TaxID=95300 RepID=A0A4R4KCN6_PSEVA|nr:transporter substrate-binding domain-containing protein [Pseudomonas vancouverensis]KAB0495808.1 transporter substrate-binding domain-containing protein [Pseudomonas vancouverensis]TDB65610.1 transporter substrate-binding domain-containing protein [Pseudomonas vancouverensis]
MLALIASCATAAESEQAYKPFQLMGRSQLAQQELSLSNDDWHWLRQKKNLVLGVSVPDYKPFDVTLSGSQYEGITADVFGLVSQLLHMPVQVRQFPNRTSAIEALKKGEIDLLGSANNYDVNDQPMNLSAQYAPEQSALFSRLNDKRTFGPSLDGMKIAMTYDYLSLDAVRKAFPGATFQVFDSRQQALGALAFGHVDFYLGDALSSNLLINENYFNYVKFERNLEIDSGGVRFAFSQDNPRLLGIINKALAVITPDQLGTIVKRWGGGTGTALNAHLNLTATENHWISEHPVLRVLISSDQAPVAFLDADGNFNGIAADLLKMVTLHTGIHFDIEYTDHLQNLANAVASDKADLVLLTASEERQSTVRFSHPFLSNPFALITRTDDNQHISLETMHGARLAIPQGHIFLKTVHTDYPDLKIIETPTLLEAMGMVQRGEADATVAELSVAQYYSLRLFDKKLRVVNVLGANSARFSFAMSRGNTELQSILDKVLLSIPPDEMNVISTRWRSNAVTRGQAWHDYRPLIYQISAAAAMLILVSLIWNANLRRQVKLRRQAEQALDDQLRFKQALINGTPHPIYVRDRQGRLVSCNDNYLETFGLTREQVIGKTAIEGAKGNASEALNFHDDYMLVMAEDRPLELDRLLKLGDRTLSIYHWIQPYRDLSGDIKGVICGWVDISERRVLVEQLQAAKEEADAASRAKTTFLATMSHEIRTPMNAVIGMLELSLKRADHGDFDRGAIEVAYGAARGLLELIGDILDIVRIESGHLNVSPQRANPRELVESVVRVFDGLARQKTLTLSLEMDSTVNTDVLIDPVRFKQVLSNLISNAIKFTEKGQIKLRVRGKPLDDDRLHLQLLVEDTGIGISEEDQQRLFQPFVQADQPAQTARGGTGLGLVICRSLCAMMGGTLSLRSTLGQGTTVMVDLTLSTLYPLPREHLPEPTQISDAGSSLRILVVDDHPANRLLMARQLTYLGHQIAEAVDGAQGYEVWARGQFDVIITDCNMPVMSGYELAQKVRETEAERQMPTCTILGFTANAQPDAVERCLAAGMNDCLFKPIGLASLSNTLSSLSALDLPAADQADTDVAQVEPVLFNLEEPERLTGRDPELMNMLLGELMRTNRSDLQQLLLLTPFTSNRQDLSDLAHRIKGAARMIQARQLVQGCETLESLCDQPETSDEQLTTQVHKVERAILELETAVSEHLS